MKGRPVLTSGGSSLLPTRLRGGREEQVIFTTMKRFKSSIAGLGGIVLLPIFEFPFCHLAPERTAAMKPVPVRGEYSCTVHKGRIGLWLCAGNYTEERHEIAPIHSLHNIPYT